MQLFVGRRQLRNLPLQLRDQPHQFVALRGREVFGPTHSQSIKLVQYSTTPLPTPIPPNQLQNSIGFHIEEAVYAPLYYGYGGADSGAGFRSGEGQRTKMARAVEREIMRLASDAALVLLRADAEVIRRRLREAPHEYQVIDEKDVEVVLARFDEEYEGSLLSNKLVLDTSNTTPAETLQQFMEEYEPYWTDADRSPTWAADRQKQIDRAWGSYL